MTASSPHSLSQKDADPYWCGYHFEFSITFWLDAADPADQENEDNILVHLPHISTITYCVDTHNYNEFFKHPTLGEQHHCYLFHNLCDHAKPPITLADILRIGEIWVRFEVEPQFIVRIDTRAQTASSLDKDDPRTFDIFE